jgi:hypothetical protein
MSQEAWKNHEVGTRRCLKLTSIVSEKRIFQIVRCVVHVNQELLDVDLLSH